MIFTKVLVFILGLVFGSFLNVVLFRHGTGISLWGRSKCFSSGENLRWFELIPVLSFVIQRGRSRHNKSKISPQYPIVEILTGFLFLFSFNYSLQSFSVFTIEFYLLFLFLVLVSSFVILISTYDVKHYIIPNEFSYTFIGLSIISLFVSLKGGFHFEIPALWNILSGPIIASPFFFLWLVSGGRWMGFADVKLGFAIGWFLPLLAAVTSIILSFWIGAVVGILLLIFGGKKFGRGATIPFGPFLLIGLIIVFWYSIDILNLASHVFL